MVVAWGREGGDNRVTPLPCTPVSPQSGQGTQEVTGWFEVTVAGRLVHSKKVGDTPPSPPPCAWVCVVSPPPNRQGVSSPTACHRCAPRVPPQKGDGFVDTDAKLQKIVAAIKARLP